MRPVLKSEIQKAEPILLLIREAQKPQLLVFTSGLPSPEVPYHLPSERDNVAHLYSFLCQGRLLLWAK